MAERIGKLSFKGNTEYKTIADIALMARKHTPERLNALVGLAYRVTDLGYIEGFGWMPTKNIENQAKHC